MLVDIWLTDSADIVDSMNKDTFLIVLEFGINNKLVSKLRAMGMRPGKDYLYIYHDTKIQGCTEYYKDIWGNEIAVIGELKKCNIRFKGWNSKVNIGMNTQLTDEIEINVGSECVIDIGNNVKISAGSTLRCEDNSKLSIGDNCVFGRSKVVSRNKTVIGSKSIFNDGLIIICEDNTCIDIGSNVLVSSNVHMRSGNGHSLFDITQEINISEKSKHIIIGNHVWIGQDTTVLFNAELGDESVVGAHSLVKGKHEKRSLVYGVPAKTMRNNIGWNVKNHMTYEEFLMMENEL